MLRRVLCVVMLCAVTLGGATLASAQSAPQPPPQAVPAPVVPAAAPSDKPDAQPQPSAAVVDDDTRLQKLLADHQYSALEAQLAKLSPDTAQLYRGLLANHSNDLAQSVSLLEPLVDSVSTSGNATQEKLIREALAEDYLRLGDWSKAAEAYKVFESRFHDKLAADEQDEIEMPLKLLPLVAGNPQMTVEPCDTFRFKVSESPLGLIEIPVSVGGRSRNWMLDPTMPFNLIARSTAREVGLTVSSESATISTLTGKPIQIRSTVIPRITIGGRLTLRDVTAFVFEDRDYLISDASYQVEGVLGFPALAAMGALTITSDNTAEVRPSTQVDPQAKDDLTSAGTPFYLDGDQILVALDRPANPVVNPLPPSSADAPGQGTTRAGGAEDEQMYAIDPGSQQTYLTWRYFKEHAVEFIGQKTEMFTPPGGQSPPQPAYTAKSIALAAGSTTITLESVPVITKPLGSAALDDVYGILGSDALGQLKSYTFDYRAMRFSAATE